jgi:ABC-type Na+ efflux pump permease subunit
MTFLPVVGRELRVASRRRQTYWRRTYAAMITLGICLWVWVGIGANTPQHERAQGLFYTIAGLAFAYSLLAGAGTTADALSEEKREGTLGLLFLTDLKGYDVVLGKLTARSVDAMYRLVAVFPLLAIPILMGGVSPGEFPRVVLVLVNTLLFSLAAGMFVSALNHDSQRAVAAALALVLCVTAGLPFLGLMSESWHLPFAKWNGFLLGSPAYGFILAFDTAFKLKARHFWMVAATTHAMTWLFLVLASILLPRTWQERPAATTAEGWRVRFRRWRLGGGTERVRFRTRLLEINPFFWLAARDRRKPQLVLALIGCGALTWFCLFLKFTNDMLDPVVFMLTAFFAHAALKYMVTTESCRQIAEDRRTGALELLLSTPLSVPEILRGQRLALQRAFFPAVAAVLLADLVMMAVKMQNRFSGGSAEWDVSFLVGVVVFVADLYTVTWVGMWLGLTSKTASRATFGVLFRVLFLPWILFFALMTVFFLSASSRSGGSDTSIIAIWVFLALLNNAWLLASSRWNLLERFRLIATQRFESGKPVHSVQNQEASPPNGLPRQ